MQKRGAQSQGQVTQLAHSYGFAVNSQDDIETILDLRYLGDTTALRELGQSVGLKQKAEMEYLSSSLQRITGTCRGHFANCNSMHYVTTMYLTWKIIS